MSKRSRAKPWFGVPDRLERYCVRVDQLDEAGGTWFENGSALVCAEDFDCERPRCERHSYGTVDRGILGIEIVACLKCHAPFNYATGDIGPARSLTVPPWRGEPGVRVVVSSRPPANPSPRSGFQRTRYTSTGARIDELPDLRPLDE